MILTPEQKQSIDQWNSLGLQIHDNSMRAFLPSWFANCRSLIKADFPLRSVHELTASLGERYDTFVVLGSGPSAQEICRRLPPKHAVLCSPTCLGALARENVRPAAIIVSDSNPVLYKHVAETRFYRTDLLDIVLPVTADPIWYSPESVIPRDRLFFYLNYMDSFGSVDNGYNAILKALFPDVPHYMTMGGSVALTAWIVADWACGDSPEKRVYLGIDCSWPKGGPYRAPLRFEVEAYGNQIRADYDILRKPINPTIEVSYLEETIETDLVSIGYAIQLLNAIHSRMRDFEPAFNRYALIDVASRLYLAASPDVVFPIVDPEGTNLKHVSFVSSEAWAYKLLLGLVELSNKLHNRLRDELVQKILADWKEKPEVQNVVDVPLLDFKYVRRAVHAVEPEVKFKFNGEEIPE